MRWVAWVSLAGATNFAIWLVASMALAQQNDESLMVLEPSGPLLVQPGQRVHFEARVGSIPDSREAWQSDRTAWGDWRRFRELSQGADGWEVRWSTMVMTDWRSAPYLDWGNVDRESGIFTAPATLPTKEGLVKVIGTLHPLGGGAGAESMVAIAGVILCFPHVDHAICRDARSPDERADREFHVCDRRELDATCLEYSVGDVFRSEEEVQRHCDKLSVGGQAPRFIPNSRCPAENRVGRCLGIRDSVGESESYGNKHYYRGLSERWNWQLGGFAPACKKLGGHLMVD